MQPFVASLAFLQTSCPHSTNRYSVLFTTWVLSLLTTSVHSFLLSIPQSLHAPVIFQIVSFFPYISHPYLGKISGKSSFFSSLFSSTTFCCHGDFLTTDSKSFVVLVFILLYWILSFLSLTTQHIYFKFNANLHLPLQSNMLTVWCVTGVVEGTMQRRFSGDQLLYSCLTACGTMLSCFIWWFWWNEMTAFSHSFQNLSNRFESFGLLPLLVLRFQWRTSPYPNSSYS